MKNNQGQADEGGQGEGEKGEEEFFHRGMWKCGRDGFKTRLYDVFQCFSVSFF